jgi:hypothetical protein
MTVTLIKKEDLKYIYRLIHFAVIEQVNAISFHFSFSVIQVGTFNIFKLNSYKI